VGGTKIFANFSEDDVGDIFLPFDGENTYVSFPLYCPLESGGIRIFSDMNGRDSVLDLSEKSDQCLQVCDFHVGDDEEIKIFSSLNQWDQILHIEGSPAPEIFTEDLVDFRRIIRIMQNVLSTHGGVTEIIDRYFCIVT